jgi:hypothetical protein
MLFLWGKTYPDFAYKQGMNEILAIVLVVFETERVDMQNKLEWDKISDKEIAENHLLEFLLDPKFSHADIFTCYDRILQLGIQLLY